MAWIPEGELARLKEGVSLQRLAEAHGVKLHKRGEGLTGCCPFHEEKTPSFVVTPAKNLFRCFGCGASGSVIDFVMKAEGVSFRHAVELLKAEVPLMPPAKPSAPPKKSTVPKLPAPVEAGAGDEALLAQVVDYYHRRLGETPAALDYLKRRGLGAPAVAAHFRLGFADRTLGLRLPATNRLQGANVRGRLQALGVLRASGHEHLAGSLVVPILDAGGLVRGLYGRKVTPNLRPGTALHLYLPGPHRGVFNEAGLIGQRTVVLCEALLDALTFWAAGFTAVTSAYGVEGFTPAHLEAFRRHGVHNVLLAYDRDDAGDAAAEVLAKRLLAEGFGCWRVQFPRGMDANEYALKVGPPVKSLGVALRQAVWMGADAAAKPAPTLLPVDSLPPSAAQRAPDVRASAAAVPGALKGERAGARGTPRPTPPSVPVRAAEGAAAPPGPPGSSAASSIAANTVPGAVGSTGGHHDPRESGPALSANVGVETAGVEIDTTATLSLVNSTLASTAPANSAPGAPASSAALATPSSSPAPADATADEVVYTFDGRRYRVRGLSKNATTDSLRLNLLVSDGTAFHVDAVELYSARQRAAFLRQASVELRVNEDVLKRDMGRLLLELEARQEAALKQHLQPKVPTPTEAEAAEALNWLRAPGLLHRVLQDFEACGVVGEETNKLVGYLAAVSRKLEEPLAILIQSSSAAGKSSLMEAVLAFVPDEDKVKYSAMTGQSLFYMGDADLKHKVLAVVEEEGAARASYALKLLQSEGELTIASTGKDPTSGKLVTHEYRVEGPTQLFLTTTASELDEELLNRCLVLTVDEERAQTKAIHEKQKEKQTLEGLLARKEREAVLKRHQTAQRLLKPLAVVNPFAKQLTFLDDRTRARRDFPKYLTLIRAIALLHQHQRPVKTAQWQGGTLEYVEVQPEDVATANRLVAAVLGQSLDELPPQTRRLLQLLDAWVVKRGAETGVAKEAVRFTRREVRAAVGLSHSQLALHLGRLVDFEYVAAHRGARGVLVYELRYDGAGTDGAPVLPGLVNAHALTQGGAALTVEAAGHHYDEGQLPGLEAQLPGVQRQLPGAEGQLPGVGSQFPGTFRGASGHLPEGVFGEKPSGLHALAADGTVVPLNAHRARRNNGAASYL